MKVAFIGLGRMGSGMAMHLLDANIDLSVYDPFEQARARFVDTNARVATSVSDAVASCDAVMTMLPSDEALDDLARSEGGLLSSLPAGAIHVPMGTHGVDIIGNLTQSHADVGQVLVAATVLGRPDLAATGQLTIVPAGPSESLASLQPLFDIQ
jgi:3-hydroxyisobutyrate dehydrogenase-like beta-hydroxyacid dehydrogenase